MQFKESRTLVLAGLQTGPVAFDPAATWTAFAAAVENARALFEDLDLIVAPELHLSAPGPLLEESPEYAEEVAVEIPGPLTFQLSELARATGLWLVPGTVYERTLDGIANSALVVSPDGELIGPYRKCFPWQPYECTQPGERLMTFDIPDVGRVGLMVCYDGMFPELPRQLAWWGAELILQPTLTTTSDREAETIVARATAIVNQVALVSVNAASPAGTGRSVFVGPELPRQLAWWGAELILQPTLTTTSDREAETIVARATAIVNQVALVSVNAASPAGTGRSVFVGPEGELRVQAGAGEEVLVDVVDFAVVERVRRMGTFGMNRLWEQWDRSAESLDLPMYGALLPRSAERSRS